MRINMTSVLVDDQAKALRFYIDRSRHHSVRVFFAWRRCCSWRLPQVISRPWIESRTSSRGVPTQSKHK
jgi:hypothetical protein